MSEPNISEMVQNEVFDLLCRYREHLANKHIPSQRHRLRACIRYLRSLRKIPWYQIKKISDRQDKLRKLREIKDDIAFARKRIRDCKQAEKVLLMGKFELVMKFLEQIHTDSCSSLAHEVPDAKPGDIYRVSCSFKKDYANSTKAHRLSS